MYARAFSVVMTSFVLIEADTNEYVLILLKPISKYPSCFDRSTNLYNSEVFYTRKFVKPLFYFKNVFILGTQSIKVSFVVFPAIAILSVMVCVCLCEFTGWLVALMGFRVLRLSGHSEKQRTDWNSRVYRGKCTQCVIYIP